MPRKLVIPPVQIRPSTIQGYGVFATRDIEKDEVIEECLCLMIHPRTACLTRYDFRWPQGKDLSVLVLGNGSIYNHADNFNAEHAIQIEDRLMIISANRFIKKDEEIFIYYGPNWFEDRHIKKVNLLSRERLKFFAKYVVKFGTVLGILFAVKMILKK